MEPLPNPNPPKGFAHPIEAEFARLLNYYHIPWQYEPVTFPLDVDDDGNLLEAFTPDFYLPVSELYVELTTRRQPLITEKNRKVARTREIYPHVRVKLLNRGQMRAMLMKYGMGSQTPRLIGDPNDHGGS